MQSTNVTKVLIAEKCEAFGLALEKGDVITINEHNKLHSHNDEPSVVRCEGMDLMWHKNGVLHRDRGPAWIMDSGKTRYFIDGKLKL